VGITFGKAGKAKEYDDLAVELHRKRGTLKEHECLLLPRTNPPPAYDPLAPVVHPDIHPGISRKSLEGK